MPPDDSRSVASQSGALSALHEQADSGALLAVNRDVDEGRDTDQVEPARCDVSTRDGDRLDRLVDGSGPDRLDLHPTLAADHASDGSCDGNWLGRGRNLQDLCWNALRCHCWNPFKYVRDRLAGST